LKEARADEVVVQALISLCEKTKEEFYYSTGIRSLLGNGDERFMFNQEESSIIKSCHVAAKYIAVCSSMSCNVALLCSGSTLEISNLLERGSEKDDPYLQNAIISFLLQQLDYSHDICSSSFDIGLIKYLVFNNLSMDKVLNKANSVTKSFSAMEYILKTILMSKISVMKNSKDFDASKFVQSYYQRNGVFQALVSVHSLFAKAGSSDPKLPIFIDHLDYLTIGGQVINTLKIKSFISYHLSSCRRKMEWLLGGFSMLDIPKGLIDNVRDRTKGKSIFSQNAMFQLANGNSIDSLWKKLVLHMLTHHNLVNDGAFVEVAIKSLYNHQFLDLGLELLVLMHITGGSPARKTELALTRISNDQRYERNIFMDGDDIYFALGYKKTSQGHNNWDPVYRYSGRWILHEYCTNGYDNL
jgi:hypothetical protein